MADVPGEKITKKKSQKSENLLSEQFSGHHSVTIISMDGEMSDQVRFLCPCKE